MAAKIMDLPEHLLVDISVRVAKACGLDALSLDMVNKAFNVQYESQSVLRKCSLEILRLYPAFEPEDAERFRRFMKKLIRAGNVEALYHKGLEHCFDATKRLAKGSKEPDELTRAADGGSRKAQLILGIILVCLGGVRKGEAYGFLAGLMRPRLSQTSDEVRDMRMTLRDVVIWRSGITAAELLSAYSHGPCEYEDTAASATETLHFLRLVYAWEDACFCRRATLKRLLPYV